MHDDDGRVIRSVSSHLLLTFCVRSITPLQLLII